MPTLQHLFEHELSVLQVIMKGEMMGAGLRRQQWDRQVELELLLCASVTPL